MNLEDRSAIVTGASAGIGEATALALADEGVRVALAARREAELEAVAERIEADGGEVLVVSTDLTDDRQVLRTIGRTREAFGDLDILVNCAGVLYRERVVDADFEEWQREIGVNLLGLMNATRAVLGGMTERGSGHVVNVSSINARKVAPGASGYVASKAGVNGFSEALRQEVTGKGVRVTVVEPGLVDTAMQNEQTRAAMALLDPADVADAIVYAVSRPEHVSVNDIQIRPTEQEF